MLELSSTDCQWMNAALEEAKKAALTGEVPVGAVIVYENNIIGRGHNQVISTCNPVAHAEILALQSAAKTINNYRLVNCDLYVTLEPCTMCAGAIIHSRIRKLIYGASEPKAGAISSTNEVLLQPQMNYRVASKGGVLSETCGRLISDLFKAKRLIKKTTAPCCKISESDLEVR